MSQGRTLTGWSATATAAAIAAQGCFRPVDVVEVDSGPDSNV